MAKSKKKVSILLSPNGSVIEYQRHRDITYPPAGHTVVDAREFTDTLTFTKATKTSYSQKISILFQNAAGATFPMFLRDLSDAIPHMVNGVLKGDFVMVKRGNKAGVRLIT